LKREGGKLQKDQDSGASTSGGTIDMRSLAADLPKNEYYRASGTKIKELIRDIVPDVVEPVIAGEMRRLVAAICLYVPNNVATSYATFWSEEDLSYGAFVDELAGAGLQVFGGNGAEAAKQAAGANVTKAAVSKLLNGMSYVQKATGITPGNAKAEQLFKGVDFRTFNLEYQFTPKSEDEAKAVLDIIRLFRYHMLPEFYDDASFLYIYPSEFEVKYYKGDKENEFLEKQMTAVLTNCNINYTPNGQFNTFENGMPTQINMNLTFKELSKPDKSTSPYDRSGV
jgi:hypothetical protein